MLSKRIEPKVWDHFRNFHKKLKCLCISMTPAMHYRADVIDEDGHRWYHYLTAKETRRLLNNQEYLKSHRIVEISELLNKNSRVYKCIKENRVANLKEGKVDEVELPSGNKALVDSNGEVLHVKKSKKKKKSDSIYKYIPRELTGDPLVDSLPHLIDLAVEDSNGCVNGLYIGDSTHVPTVMDWFTDERFMDDDF